MRSFLHMRAVLVSGICAFLWVTAFSGSTCQSILDSDGDTIINSLDAFPFNPDEQYDTDGDGTGDNADLDDDGDGVPDIVDGPLIDTGLRSKLALLNSVQDAFPAFEPRNNVPDLLEFDALIACQADTASQACRDALALLPGGESDRIRMIAIAGQPVFLFQYDSLASEDRFPVQVTQPFPLGDTDTSDEQGTVLLGNLLGDNRDRGILDADTDNDGIPDLFEIDRDGDGVLDTADAFPDDPSETGDNDGDGLGNNLDCNDDGPGGVNTTLGFCIPPDRFIRIDINGDGIADGADGDCDADQDGDGFIDDLGADGNGDGLIDLAGPVDCVVYLQNSAANGDGFSDPVDLDVDKDADFFCPATISQCDLQPDELDNDTDNDGCPDTRPPDDPTPIPNCPPGGDAFPIDSGETEDTDSDGVGDNSDVCPSDAQDQCPPRGPLDDFDGDTLANNADPDIDGDGVLNEDDRFPLDPAEFADNDLDGIGDNGDPDDDNDGLPDALECQPEVMIAALAGNQLLEPVDLIDDPLGLFAGVTLNTEECAFTNAFFPDSDLDGLSDQEEWLLLTQALLCGPTDEIFDVACPLALLDILDPTDVPGPPPAIRFKRTFPPLDPNSDADTPEGAVMTVAEDPQALDGSDPAPFVIGTEDADSDGDGLLDSLERFYGTNPFQADSDDDGLDDNLELAVDEEKALSCTPLPTFEISTISVTIRGAPPASCAGCLPARVDTICRFNPCDPLLLLATCVASAASLNPNVADVDGDGLLDGEEMNGRILSNGVKVRTNPVLADTDNQGADTGLEDPNPNCAEGLGGAPCGLGGGPAAAPISFPDGSDNCPIIPNSDQRDVDFDGVGDLQTLAPFPGGASTPTFQIGLNDKYGCDDKLTLASGAAVDSDTDGLTDSTEVLPQAPRFYPTNPGDSDTDNDGIGDNSDNCPLVANAPQTDTDVDGLGDACDNNPGAAGGGARDIDDGTDSDLDGLTDCEEFFGLRRGGFRSALDTADSDSDGILDSFDNCPCTANDTQSDSSGDGVGDVCQTSIGAICLSAAVPAGVNCQ
ncbi:MAG: thrombospondin type 3 repeat-containing protein [Bdellovibrionota bacterium]